MYFALLHILKYSSDIALHSNRKYFLCPKYNLNTLQQLKETVLESGKKRCQHK